MLCLSGTLVFCPKGGVAGKIQDLNNGESAFNAAVRIAEIGKERTLIFDGYYSLQELMLVRTLWNQLLGYQKDKHLWSSDRSRNDDDH